MNEIFKGKANTNGFGKNPQNINRKGRPKKGFAHVNQLLQEKGYEPVSKKEYSEFVAYMINCTEDDLKKLYLDKSLPLYLRLMIEEMRNPKTRSLVIRDLRDFIFGKAVESVEVKQKARVLTNEELDAEIEMYEKFSHLMSLKY